MSSLEAESFIWIPLNVQRSEIRILRLEPAVDHDADLKGSFEARSLEHHPRYDAVSHAWGPPGPSEPFLVEGVPVYIPLSLARCLRQLRETNRVRLLWVDALCVAQHDLVERAQQVQLMQRTFSYSMNVRIWLGSGSADVTRGFRFLKDILDGPQQSSARQVWGDGHQLAYTETPQYAALSALARVAWWERLWVVQEAILARGLFIHYDNMSIDCANLDQLDKKLHLPKGNQRNFFVPSVFLAASAERDMDRDFRKAIQNLVGLRQFATMLQDVLTRDATDKALVTILLFCSNRARLAHDPRDRIYGSLGVCNAFFGDFMEVSYTSTVEHVYTEFAGRLIEKSGSLAILNQASNRYTTTMNLPSWVPDWGSTYDHENECSRLYQWQTFCACGPAPWPKPRVHGRQLVLQGFLVDEVETVDDCIIHRLEQLRLAIPRWFEYAMSAIRGKKLSLKEVVKHTMWPTAVKVRLVDVDSITFTLSGTDAGDVVLYEWTREKATKMWIESMMASAAFRGHLLWLLDDGGTAPTFAPVSTLFEARTQLSKLQRALEHDPIDQIHGDLKPWLRSLYTGMAKSKLFRPKKKWLGVGSSDAQPGDVIAILAGAHVPFMLRRQVVRGKKQIYSIVGEVYLRGCMKGELLVQEDGTKQPWEEICIE